jgi:hypothetical protein
MRWAGSPSTLAWEMKMRATLRSVDLSSEEFQSIVA